jgi:acetyl-CoA carboxylase biotin carboxyl carrier protein
VSLTAADVAEIMRLLEQSNFDELTLEMDGIKLCLRRGALADPPVPGAADRATADSPLPGAADRATAVSPTPGVAHTAAVTAGPDAAAATANAPRPAPAIGDTAAATTVGSSPPALGTNTPAAPADPNVHAVASPLLGTFYRAPKPGAPPFVEVGAQVEEETVVAIIEVMKLMNTVRAGVRGTVTEILIADGALAEYGETLMRVRKAG